MKTKRIAGAVLAMSLGLGVVALVYQHSQSSRIGQQQGLQSSSLNPHPSSQVNGASRTRGPAELQVTASSDESLTAFRGWLERAASERNAGQELSPQLLAEGLQLAEARRPAMFQLIRTNPWLALNQSLKWEEWTMLPPEVQSLVEEPFSEIADLEFLPDCRPVSARTTARQSHFLRTTNRRFDAFVYGRRMELTSKLGVTTQGIRLGNDIALWESPVLPLDSRPLAAVQSRFPVGGVPGRSWRTGDPLKGDASTALIGGKLYYFNSPEEIAEVSQALSQGEQALGPISARSGWAALGDGRTFDTKVFLQAASAAGTSWTESPKRILGIRLDFTPTAGTPFTATELTDRLLVSSNVIRQISYGKTWIVPTVTTQVLILPHSRAEYEAGTFDLASDARGLTAVAGFNLANFDLYLYSYPPTAGAPGSAGGQNVFINGSQPASIFVHEFGHSYGLGHANSWQAQTGTGFLGHPQTDGSFIEHHEYGDVFDIMGPDRHVGPSGDPVFPNGHFSMSGKAHLNWIEPARVIEVTSNNVYRIHRFDHPSALNNPSTRLALKIKNADGEALWVGLRRNFNLNSSLSTGAYIVWAPSPNWHRLIDTTPLSQSNLGINDDKEDAALPINQTYTDPTRTVHITNLGFGGSSPQEYLDIQVTLVTNSPDYELFTDFARTTRGLTGSYVNQNLRGDSRNDWRQTPGLISGTRTDARLQFPSSGWGARSALGLTGGTDSDWDNFSVQWDGHLVVHRPVALATKSDDGSHMWIDLNNDAAFATSGRELINNHWGTGQATTIGASSPTVPPGTYRIRIQYEEGSAGNSFSLVSSRVDFELFADAGAQTNGLTGSYVNLNLRSYTPQNDWRTSQTIAERRLDSYPGFISSGWGTRSTVGLTGGSDEDWDNFSVQWDGYIRVYQPSRFASVSDDGSRLWLDLNDDGAYGSTVPEFLNNHWGTGQGPTLGELSGGLNAGTYRVRMQYEEGAGGNYLMFAGRSQITPNVDVTFSFASQTVTETTSIFNVDVYLSEPSEVPVIVMLQTAGTADAGDCLLQGSSPRTLVFPPGEVAKQVRLQLLNDAIWEGQETFTLQFTNYIGAVPGTFTTFTVRINDSQAVPTAGFGNFSTSFQEAITSPSVPVQLSAPVGIPVKVNVAVTGGTATGGGVDYSLNSGTVYFEVGETQKNVAVTCINDALDEADETLTFTLSPGSSPPPDGYAGIGVSGITSRTFTIADDDTPPTASLQQIVFIVPEGQSTNAIVRLSKPSALNVAFNIDRTSGNASASDIQISPPSLTFLPGETQKVVTVTALDDTLMEGDEGFLLTMTSAANVILGSPRAFYIRDADGTDVAPENPTGLGANPGHRVRFRKAAAAISLNTVNDAEALLGYPLPDARVSFEVNDDGVSVINYIDASTDTAPQGYFEADRDFHSVPGSPTFAAGNIDQAAMEARGYLYVPTAGNWNFIVRSDDGFRLRIGSNNTVVAEQFIGRAPGDTFTVVDFPQPGYYRYQLTYFEYAGGAQVEFLALPPFAASGTNLVGSNEDGLLVFRDLDIPPLVQPVREPFLPLAAGHSVTFRRSSFNQTNISAAIGLFALPTTDARVPAIASDNGVSVINYDDMSGVTGFFGNDRQIATPSLIANKGSFAAGADDNFAMRAVGFLQVTNPGVWSFVVNSDDGFQLRLGTNNSVVSSFPDPRGLAATTNRVHLPVAGFYPYELLFFEWGGGALIEFFAFGPGQPTPLLVGDPAGAIRVYWTGSIELRLTITRSANQAILRWPSGATGYTLERASIFAEAATVWTPVSGTPTLVGDSWQQTDSITFAPRYYRLRKP